MIIFFVILIDVTTVAGRDLYNGTFAPFIYPLTYIYTFPMSRPLKLLRQIHTSIDNYIWCWLFFNNVKQQQSSGV